MTNHDQPHQVLDTSSGSNGRSLLRAILAIVTVLATVACGLLAVSAPALAAAPEAPETAPAKEVSNTTAVLNGVLNPHGRAQDGWYFAYNTGSSCMGGFTTSLQAGAEEVEAEIVTPTEITSLRPGTAYTFCLVAVNLEGETTAGVPLSFTTTAAAPTIESEYFEKVGSGSAELHAQIDTHGSPTSFHVEYGLDAAYGSLTSNVALAPSTHGSDVHITIEGLQPEIAYHFRFVSTSAFGSDRGADTVLTTLATGISGLPDGRIAELVSLPDNDVYSQPLPEPGGAEETFIISSLPSQAAEDGSRLAYVSDPTVTGGNGEGGVGRGNEQLATRIAPGVWSNANVEPEGYLGPAYQAFSNDLSLGVIGANPAPEGAPALSSVAPTNTEMLYTRALPEGDYKPFFLATPIRNLFTEGVPQESSGPAPLDFAGASADFGSLLFEANGPLTEGSIDGGRSVNNLYDSSDGEVLLINVLPDGSTEPNATFGAPWQPAGEVINAGPNLDHVISADGSRVFWTDLNPGHENLYVRENPGTADATTTQVDQAVGGGGVFWAASADGSKVYFTKGDLYQYDTATHATVDIAPGSETQGVLAASEDGTYVYFAARAALAPGATPQTCNQSPGTIENSWCNLYLYHEGQPLRFIARLRASDGNDVPPYLADNSYLEPGDWIGNLGYRTAEVTPNGHDLVFMSSRQLTDSPTEGVSEVYLFDADSGNLTCVSCNRTGGTATGLGIVPISRNLTRQARWVSNDGSRVFFASKEGLVARDTNGVYDVYEWERDGVGSCRTEAGCVYLLTGGTSPVGSELLETTPSGDDVFVITRADLVPQDETETDKVYDLSTTGVAPLAQPACTGTGCQGVPAAPPIFATPASVTFAGVGNFPPSAKATAKPRHKQKARKKAKTKQRHGRGTKHKGGSRARRVGVKGKEGR